MIARKCRRREDLVRRIDQHIILLGFQEKTANALDKSIGRFADRHIIVDVILARLQNVGPSRWMRHELSTFQEMVGRAVPKRVTQKTVKASKSATICDQPKMTVS